ncbi:MAG: baseplate J/gp47 family protein [Comamonas sp.]
MTTPLNVPVPGIEELRANAARLLQQSLAYAAQGADPQALGAFDLELARSNVKALSFVQAAGLHGAYRYMRDFIARQAVPIYSSGDFLDGWMATYGMPRKEAAAARGTATGSGVDGAILEADTLLQHGDGRQYRVLADAVVSAGVVTPALAAQDAGLAGDVAAGEALTLVSPVTGIDSAFVASAGLTGGADIETDAQAIYRLQQRLANEPMGGSPADYARWALQVAGITRAWGVRNPAGPTSAGVIIMADGNVTPGLPTEGQRQIVYDYIRDPRRAPPDELHVIVPDAVVVPFTIRLSPDTAAIRTAVMASLADLFFLEAQPGQGLPVNHVVEAISSVTGEYNHTLFAPEVASGAMLAVDSYDQLLVLGTVEFV